MSRSPNKDRPGRNSDGALSLSPLELAQIRTPVAIVVAAKIWDSLADENTRVAAVVDDVTALTRNQPEPHTLTGRLGLADNYLGEVTFERDDDGDEVYRAEFCPEEDVDETLYSRQVWQHHVRETGEPAMIIAQEVHAHAKAATPVAT
jgi:hypothetical protein